MERRERSEVPARRAVVPVVCARLRMPLVWLGMAGIVGAVAGLDAVAIVGPVVLVLGLAMY
nr:hypothetical protein [Actinomycetota bacterium]